MRRRLDHVGVLVASIEAAVGIYERLGFSLERIERFVDDSGQETRIAFLDVGGELDLELIESPGLLAAGQEPLNHICFEVPDIERELRSLHRAGTPVEDSVPRRGVSAPRIAFLAAEAADGVRIELAEKHSREQREVSEVAASAWVAHLPPGINPRVDLTAARTLPALWSGRWAAEPEAVAVVDLSGTEERVLSRGDLLRRTEELVALMSQHGVRRSDRVLFSAAPSTEYLLLYLAALRLGATIVPANTAYRDRELGWIASDSDPVLAIIDEPHRAAWLECPTLDPRNLPAVDLDGAVPILDRASPAELGMIAYTSGTTGRPKGAMLTHANLLASAQAVRLAWRWREEDGLVLALPLFHVHGLGVGVHGSLAAGGRILLTGSFDAGQVAHACRRDDATMFFGVPTMYRRLADLAATSPVARDGLSSLRLMVSGSAPLPAELWERFRELTGQSILERYGMTETVMLLSNPYTGERRRGTVGFPLPGVEVRLDGNGCGGEIEVRGPNVFAGYLGDEQATAEAFTDDGFFRTGDLGSRSNDGYVSIVGRTKELIISGGYNIYPREVEEILEEHSAVREAAVCGVPSPEWGEMVVAIVVAVDPHQPPELAEIVAHCDAHLASYKKPRRVVFVDALPRNAMGKLSRSELSALLR